MKVFPEAWEVCAADTVCSEIVDCLNKTAPIVEHDTGYRMIRTTNVRYGRVDVSDNRFVEEAVFRRWTRRACPRLGDIVLSREAPLGEVGLLRSDAKVFLGQRTMLYRANPQRLDQHYLYYQMIGPYVQAVIHGQGSGSTVAHLRVPDAETLPIPMAPLSVQRKIAAVLAAYDELIEANRRRIELLKTLAEEIYREWFVRRRFPGHENAKIVKGVPQGWEQRRLPEIANITYGFPFDASRFNTDGRDRPIIRIRNIPESSTTDYTDEEANDKYVVRHGDLLVGMDGEFHINHWHGDDAYLVQRVCRIEAKEPILESYLAHAIRAPIKHFESILMGATVGHLGAMHLKSIVLLVPPEPLRGRLHILNDIHRQKLSLAKASRNLAATRDRLLPRLISGKLSVENLDIHIPPGMTEELEAVA
jgi:type I restriction enzyme S subunit